MAEPRPGQSGEALVAELAATRSEQAAVSRRQAEQLQDRFEHRMQLIASLAVRVGSWLTLPLAPPVSLDCMGEGGDPHAWTCCAPSQRSPCLCDRRLPSRL